MESTLPRTEKLRIISLPLEGAATPAREHYMPDSPVARIQAAVQRFPWLYSLIKSYLAPTWSLKSWRAHVPDPSSHVVVNLGAGTTRLDPEVVNVDFVSFPGVDLVADLGKPLPIRDASVDAVLCISVLEHLEKPALLVSQVARILKPGGIFYIAVPFQYPFHGAPHDFWRWTIPGLGHLVENEFTLADSGPRGGAFGILILSLAHALARILCFGSGKLYSLVNFSVMGLLAPLKLLDLALFPLPFGTVFCPGLYVVAKRRP